MIRVKWGDQENSQKPEGNRGKKKETYDSPVNLKGGEEK